MARSLLGGTKGFWARTLQIRETVTDTSQAHKDRDCWKVQCAGNQKEADENVTTHLMAEGPVHEVWGHAMPSEGSGGHQAPQTDLGKQTKAGPVASRIPGQRPPPEREAQGYFQARVDWETRGL